MWKTERPLVTLWIFQAGLSLRRFLHFIRRIAKVFLMPNAPVSHTVELNRSITYLKRRFPCLKSSFIYQISPSTLCCYATLWIFPNSNPAYFHGRERTTPLYCHWLQHTNTTWIYQLAKIYISEALILFYFIRPLHAADFKGFSELNHFTYLQTAVLQPSFLLLVCFFL